MSAQRPGVLTHFARLRPARRTAISTTLPGEVRRVRVPGTELPRNRRECHWNFCCRGSKNLDRCPLCAFDRGLSRRAVLELSAGQIVDLGINPDGQTHASSQEGFRTSAVYECEHPGRRGKKRGSQRNRARHSSFPLCGVTLLTRSRGVMVRRLSALCGGSRHRLPQIVFSSIPMLFQGTDGTPAGLPVGIGKQGDRLIVLGWKPTVHLICPWDSLSLLRSLPCGSPCQPAAKRT
jgi:hypothetical protein